MTWRFLVIVSAIAVATLSVAAVYYSKELKGRVNDAGRADQSTDSAESAQKSETREILIELLRAAKSVEARLTELLSLPEPAPIGIVLDAFGPVSKLQGRMQELHGLQAATSLVNDSTQHGDEERAMNDELDALMGVVKELLQSCIERLRTGGKA